MFPRRRRRAPSPQQLHLAEAIVEEWASCSVSTEPADRPAAERAIRELYRLHGWPAPGFVWVDSPLGGEVAAWILGARPAGPDRGRHSLREILSKAPWDEIAPGFLESVLASVRHALGDELRLDDPPGQHLYSDTWPDTWAGGRVRLPFYVWLLSLPGTSPFPDGHRTGPLHIEEALRKAYHSQVRHAVRLVLDESFTPPPPEQWRHLTSGQAYRALQEAGRAQAMWSSRRISPLGPAATPAASWISRYDLYRRMGLVRYPREIDMMLDLCVTATRSCGFWTPYPQLCVVSDRPTRFEFDLPRPHQPRPHNATGPALVWRDGWSIHAWRGVGVSKALIDGELTITDWLRERNAEVRRAILERMGYEWLLDNGTARKIATDDYGTLWWILDPYSLIGIVVVDVVNATPEPDGSFKRYILRVPPDQTVPRDAIGWTFGLQPGEYGPTTMT
ncbi:DUF6745 domain-containing protein [Streptosporangium sp. H16]|uniref:DUF6745 domain-containing protein n=1 Tax=Streptosporangium sp. H16 TaxID=3444184 RepID=UPI003F78DE8B